MRRSRLTAAVLLFVLIAVFYTRRGTTHLDLYAAPKEKIVGGGAVLRAGDSQVGGQEQQPAKVVDKFEQELELEVQQETVPEPLPTSSVVRTTVRAATTTALPDTTEIKAAEPTKTLAPVQQVEPSNSDDEEDMQYGYGPLQAEIPLKQTTGTVVHWSSLQEKFPVTSIIQLPTAAAIPMPRIQHTGKASGKVDAERLAAIKASAEHAWGGYRGIALGADEVKPVSGGTRNNFGGWGATLVDSLDTLWIMNMTEAFEEAVEAVEAIDFTVSAAPEIPLFETTIRYIGGLIAAYDVSGHKHKVLLEKAVELAEVLYGAFDTPNRMPQTYYQWKPAFASQPHRAGNRVVLAEIGSLSLEFTRLAQLTREPKYYDAIARITDALDEWQNKTRVPGMWPTVFDGSGCMKVAKMGSTQTTHSVKQLIPGGDGEEMVASLPVRLDSPGRERLKSPQQELREDVVHGKAGTGKILGFGSPLEEGSLDSKESRQTLLDVASPEYGKKPANNVKAGGRIIGFGDPIEEGSLDGKSLKDVEQLRSSRVKRSPPELPPSNMVGGPVCIEQGLGSTSSRTSETYSLGGMSDSTYEYLPKEYMLLGGAVRQYKDMYLASAETEIEKLIFRPMTVDGRDILLAGALKSTINRTDNSIIETFEASGEHLGCFAGGMFAMGGRLFNRPEDVEIGRKLTDGCVWAYNSTATGIMPEQFTVVPCESKDSCVWNETRYLDLLDPWAASRTKAARAESTLAALPPDVEMGEPNIPLLRKRQAPDTTKPRPDDSILGDGSPAQPKAAAAPLPQVESLVDAAPDPVPAKHPSRPIYTPAPPLSHEEFVSKKIKDERLPTGFLSMPSRKYILRPEAIESVFYMYRITGEQYWRDVGWNMFMAVDQHTRAAYGHSAIDDVTKSAPEQVDSMESFWLAETLKYFYLLFDDKDTWSLDDWVLNTEAHFFRRPREVSHANLVAVRLSKVGKVTDRAGVCSFREGLGISVVLRYRASPRNSVKKSAFSFDDPRFHRHSSPPTVATHRVSAGCLVDITGSWRLFCPQIGTEHHRDATAPFQITARGTQDVERYSGAFRIRQLLAKHPARLADSTASDSEPAEMESHEKRLEELQSRKQHAEMVFKQCQQRVNELHAELHPQPPVPVRPEKTDDDFLETAAREQARTEANRQARCVAAAPSAKVRKEEFDETMATLQTQDAQRRMDEEQQRHRQTQGPSISHPHNPRNAFKVAVPAEATSASRQHSRRAEIEESGQAMAILHRQDAQRKKEERQREAEKDIGRGVPPRGPSNKCPHRGLWARIMWQADLLSLQGGAAAVRVEMSGLRCCGLRQMPRIEVGG